MHTVLGLVGLALFVVCVVALAAAVTAAVVRVSPTQDKPQQHTQDKPQQQSR